MKIPQSSEVWTRGERIAYACLILAAAASLVVFAIMPLGCATCQP